METILRFICYEVRALYLNRMLVIIVNYSRFCCGNMWNGWKNIISWNFNVVR